MDNKLLIGGIVVIVALLAIPIVGAKLRGSGYDPAADTQKMDILNRAIANYARTNNQYPPSLHNLVPNFVAEVPLNSLRQQFQYDPRTGTVVNPASPAATPEETAGQRPGRGGGISPATDAMTGLSVSEELNF